ncbi:hypothetical protein, partial [Lentzea sp. CC55]|uniref:hypothetical protein n=1 Tax=Lentzea sp. CC55 TaxID=2884909 RepID=UPI001F395393
AVLVEVGGEAGQGRAQAVPGTGYPGWSVRSAVDVRGMKIDDDILNLIRQDSGLTELLCHVCEFDLSRGDHVEPVRLSSGVALEGVAGDSTGGTFFLCGDRQAVRPLLYASSEEQAGLIGQSLAAALEIMIGLPSWHDCLSFSGAGDLAAMRTTAEHLGRDELDHEPALGGSPGSPGVGAGLEAAAHLGFAGVPACCSLGYCA